MYKKFNGRCLLISFLIQLIFIVLFKNWVKLKMDYQNYITSILLNHIDQQMR